MPHNPSFLHLVAEDLLERFGPDLHDLTVVFPNKRAGLFMTEEFHALSPDRPVWAPRYMTLGELFLELSPHQLAEPVDTVIRLFHHYARLSQSTETLDHFYGWGQILLSDFDDIDKHMASPEQVFAHASDLDRLSDPSYLTPEQIQALRRFLHLLDTDDPHSLCHRYSLLWERLLPLYEALRKDLLADNLLYEGALQRDVVERLQQGQSLPHLPAHPCFVGFNLLHPVERQLMKHLASQSLFYWDYDRFYLSDPRHEAGLFMRQNLRDFPSALPEHHFDNLSRLGHLEIITTSTDSAAARYAHNWLSQTRHPQANHNAIVLCNEQLLLPLLHALPDADADGNPLTANITMGFPLAQTPVFSLLSALLALFSDGWDARRQAYRPTFLRPLRHHPYAAHLQPILAVPPPSLSDGSALLCLIHLLEEITLTLTPESNPADAQAQLHLESLYQAHRLLRLFHRQLTHPQRPLQLQPVTLRRLLLNALRLATIPFHGEPATGVQLMGMLETRCLDFPHLLILSPEEDQMPRPTQVETLLPHTVRQAHSLTTPQQRNALFAYHFFRLIQRTESLTLVLNTHTSAGHRHEPSRYLLQLLALLPDAVPTLRSLVAPMPTTAMSDLTLQSAAPTDHLLTQTLSPTALNTFLQCPRRFYWRYVRRLRPADAPVEENPRPLLGNIFHDAAQILYTPAPQLPMLETAVDLAFTLNVPQRIDDEDRRNELIRRALDGHRFPRPRYHGQLLLLRDVVLHYLRQLRQLDTRLQPFTVVATETEATLPLTLTLESGVHTLKLGGRIDRLDRLADGALRIVDYKTGAPHIATPTLQAAFADDATHQDHTLQALLYAAALHEREPQAPLLTALIYLRQAHQSQFDPTLNIAPQPGGEATTDVRPLLPQFLDSLRQLLAEIFAPGQTFPPTAVQRRCQQCPFAILCHRQHR